MRVYLEQNFIDQIKINWTKFWNPGIRNRKIASIMFSTPWGKSEKQN